MRKAPFQLSLILAGVLAAGGAAAGPYDYWQSSVSDDDVVRIDDSFNRESSVSTSISSDDDSYRSSSRSEDNDYTSTWTSSVSEDNDVWQSHREDNDYTSIYRSSEDNDVTTTEDNDYTSTVSEDNDVTTTLDFQIATPTMTSHKFQDQDAGHQADTQVYGAAR